jgi:hypothetical protein
MYYTYIYIYHTYVYIYIIYIYRIYIDIIYIYIYISCLYIYMYACYIYIDIDVKYPLQINDIQPSHQRSRQRSFSVIKACGLSVARLQTALRMDPLKAHGTRGAWGDFSREASTCLERAWNVL